MSLKMRFQVRPKTFRLDGWIAQRIRQWVPNRRTGDWESPGGAKCAAVKPRNIQFATAGRTEMLANGNFRDWHSAVGKVPWNWARRHRWTVTACLYCTLCGIVSQCGYQWTRHTVNSSQVTSSLWRVIRLILYSTLVVGVPCPSVAVVCW